MSVSERGLVGVVGVGDARLHALQEEEANADQL